MSNSKKLLSLFSGCGGMDLGFEGNFTVPSACINWDMHPNEWYTSLDEHRVKLNKNSFETVFANDILPYAEAAWKTFFKSQGKDVERIFHTTSIVELVKRHQAGEHVFPENVDVVTGGFPCQDFSVAGKRGGFQSHKNHNNKIDGEVSSEESRGSLYLWMRQVIEITNPKVFVAENVKGLISLGDAKRIIEEDFRTVGSGYLVVPAKVLTAANYGVAQNRERIIFIGLNKAFLKPGIIARIEAGEIDVYPPKTHSAEPTELQHHFTKSKQVLSNLKEPEITLDPAQAKYSKAKYCKGTQGQTEVNQEGLAPTIRAEHHGNIEYRRLRAEYGGKNHNELAQGLIERRLTVRECARIQSFPDEYEFVFTKKNHDYSLSASGAYKVIGNAVPPLMAFNIAKHLENIWDNIFD
ncbi:DNA (cytosine-5-)-methyltransferase [Shewanella sp. OPT22]|nr:DNA (cytosine-5-)-methyltransferase [Shewanella sp. OPT22]